jgi:hydrogenase expression/formation protein HypE
MNNVEIDIPPLSCPIPVETQHERITLGYGEGGYLTRKFIRERLLPRFDNLTLRQLGDAAILDIESRRIVFTTDCYTVTPLFFPGGDIGKLAVFGTVNDLAVSGAIPRWLSLSLVIEEGLAWKTLDRVLDSIQAAAASACVMIVTGDTKVVPRGAVDQLFITTSGIGELEAKAPPGPELLRDGDVLIASGPIGCHGASILCAREHLEFDPIPTSDCADVTAPLVALQRAGVAPRAIRDATRGGIAAILQEWAESSRQSCVIEETLIPLNAEVRSLCELLGLDPLHLANEGTFVLATAPQFVERTMKILHQHAVSSRATVIGKITPRRVAPVMVVRGIGREVVLDEPIGAPLPRIC